MYAVLENRSVTEDVLSTTMCIAVQALNARPLTPVSSDVNDLEALTPNHFLLGNRNVCLPYLPCAEEFVDHRKFFRQTQAYANLIWDRFRKEYLPTLNNRQKWRSTTSETLKEGDLVWLIEDNAKRGYYNLGRVTETIDGFDGVIRSAIVAPFTVHMRRLLKGIWTKNGQHWDNEVEPGDEAEFLRWKKQLPIVATTSIDRRYFNRDRDNTELHVFADASEDTMCAVAYLRPQPKEYSADLSFVIGKCRVATMRHLSIPRLELQAAVMAVRLKEQIVKEHEMKINSYSFW